MEFMDQVYNEMKHFGLVSNFGDFSKLMNRSPRYFSMIRATDKPISISALSSLASNLKSIHETYRTSRLGELREKSILLTPCLRRCFTELYERSKCPKRKVSNTKEPLRTTQK